MFTMNLSVLLLSTALLGAEDKPKVLRDAEALHEEMKDPQFQALLKAQLSAEEMQKFEESIKKMEEHTQKLEELFNLEEQAAPLPASAQEKKAEKEELSTTGTVFIGLIMFGPLVYMSVLVFLGTLREHSHRRILRRLAPIIARPALRKMKISRKPMSWSESSEMYQRVRLLAWYVEQGREQCLFIASAVGQGKPRGSTINNFTLFNDAEKLLVDINKLFKAWGIFPLDPSESEYLRIGHETKVLRLREKNLEARISREERGSAARVRRELAQVAEKVSKETEKRLAKLDLENRESANEARQLREAAESAKKEAEQRIAQAEQRAALVAREEEELAKKALELTKREQQVEAALSQAKSLRDEAERLQEQNVLETRRQEAIAQRIEFAASVAGEALLKEVFQLAESDPAHAVAIFANAAEKTRLAQNT